MEGKRREKDWAERERSSCSAGPMPVLASALQNCPELGKMVRPLYPPHASSPRVSSPGRGMIVDPGNSQKGGGGRGDSWSLSTDSTPSRRGSARPPVKGHLGGPSSPRCPFQEKAQWKSKDPQQNHKEDSLVWVSLLCPLCDHLLLKGDSFPFPKITSTLLYYPALGRPFHHKVSHRLEKQSNVVS